MLIEPDSKLAGTICGWLENTASVVHISDTENAITQASTGDWNLVITDINSSEINNKPKYDFIGDILTYKVNGKIYEFGQIKGGWIIPTSWKKQ